MIAIPPKCPECNANTNEYGCEEECGWKPENKEKANARVGQTQGGDVSVKLTPEPQVKTNMEIVDCHKRMTSIEDKLSKLHTNLSDYLRGELKKELGSIVENKKDEIEKKVVDFTDKKISEKSDEITNLLNKDIFENLSKDIDKELGGIKNQQEENILNLEKKIDNLINEKTDIDFLKKNVDVNLTEKINDLFEKSFAIKFSENLEKILFLPSDHFEVEKKIIRNENKLILSWWRKLFFWLSGSDENLLAYCSKHESDKYVALGMAMLIPMAMAFFTCFHLIRQHFPEDDMLTLLMAFLFSSMWSMVIMVIDRMLLVTYRREGGLIQVGWRLLIALTFAIIFDATLLPTIFQRDIQAESKIRKENIIAEIENRFSKDKGNYFNLMPGNKLEILDENKESIARLEEEKKKIQVELTNIDALKKDAASIVSCEEYGGNYNGRQCKKKTNNRHEKYDQAKLEYDKLVVKYDDVNDKINKNDLKQDDIRGENKKIEQEIENVLKNDEYKTLLENANKKLEEDKVSANVNGLSEENEILFSLLIKSVDQGDYFRVAMFFAVMFGFILVDVFPILIKVSMREGDYDFLLRAEESSRVENGKKDNSDGMIINGFNYTSHGLDITKIKSNLDASKLYTALPIIRKEIDLQLERFFYDGNRDTFIKSQRSNVYSFYYCSCNKV